MISSVLKGPRLNVLGDCENCSNGTVQDWSRIVHYSRIVITVENSVALSVECVVLAVLLWNKASIILPAALCVDSRGSMTCHAFQALFFKCNCCGKQDLCNTRIYSTLVLVSTHSFQ